jgi:diguanylate cyclase (GGDEF)-like protein
MFIPLDRPTLSLVLGVVASMTALVVTVIWRTNQSLPGVRWWLAAAWLVVLRHTVAPSAIALGLAAQPWHVLSQMASISMVIALLLAAVSFRGFQIGHRMGWLSVLVFEAGLNAYFQRDSLIHRLLVHDALVIGLLLVTAAVLIWRMEQMEPWPQCVAALAVLLMAAGVAARWWVAYTAPDDRALLAHPWPAYLRLAMSLFLVGWTYFLSLMCNQQAQLRVMTLAREDGLTGLPNRRYFDEVLGREVARCQRGGAGFALVMIDLNGFKRINDQFGHAVGDAVLVEVARRLREFGRTGDFVARLGGDEFSVLVHGVANSDTLASALQRLRTSLDGPAQRLGQPVTIQASLGGALCPAHARYAGDLLKLADQRMYEEKTRLKALADTKI